MAVIRIEQWPDPVTCKRETILQAALAAGVPYPYGCRAGDCGTCKTKLIEGDVSLDPYDSSVLPDSERRAGLILACRARPKTDVRVAWMTDAEASVTVPKSRRFRTRLVEKSWVTHDIIRIRLQPETPMPFLPGQYADLYFAKLPARPYSMASTPGDPVLEFHVRLVKDGLISTHLAQHAQLGDNVEVDGPLGTAYFRPDHTGPIIAIAGGTGLAPIWSIMTEALRQDPARQIHLFVGVRDDRDVYLDTECEALAERHPGFRRTVVLSVPSNGAAERRRTGFVHQVLPELGQVQGAKIYIAGPPPMVDASTKTILDLGAANSDVHADAFYAAQPPAEKPAGFGQRLRRLFG